MSNDVKRADGESRRRRPSITRDFVLAGRATFIVETPDDYYTFHVRQKQYKRGGRVYWFVSQNTRKGGYIAAILPDSGELDRTDGCWMPEDDIVYVTLQIALECVWNRELLPENWKVTHAGRCGVCNRKLKTPESIELGFGPTCRGQRNMRRIKRTNHLSVPDFGGGAQAVPGERCEACGCTCMSSPAA